VGGRSLLTTSTTAGILMTNHKHLIAVYDLMDSIWITSPEGSESFFNGKIMTINWNQTMNHDMKVELFTNGFFVTTIADSVMGNSCNWQIPQNFTFPDYSNGSFQVKVSSRLNNNLYDFSEDLLFHPVYTPGVFGNSTLHLSIVPNPARDVIWLSLEGLSNPENVAWFIYSVDGKKLKEGRLIFERNGVEKYLRIDELPEGTYILVVETARQTLSKKLLIE
jgi:hypothetical protein